MTSAAIIIAGLFGLTVAVHSIRRAVHHLAKGIAETADSSREY